MKRELIVSIIGSIIATLALAGIAWIGEGLLQPGPIRDIGFYVIVALVIFAVIWFMTKLPTVSLLLAKTSGSANERFNEEVIIFRAEVDDRHMAQDADPFLLFTFWLFNGSLSPIYVKEVKGHTRFADRELGGLAELYGQQADIPHAGQYKLVIRQWLQNGASRIHQTVAAGSRSEFRFDAVYATIARRSPGLESIEHRLELPCLSTQSKKWEIKWD